LCDQQTGAEGIKGSETWGDGQKGKIQEIYPTQKRPTRGEREKWRSTNQGILDCIREKRGVNKGNHGKGRVISEKGCREGSLKGAGLSGGSFMGTNHWAKILVTGRNPYRRARSMPIVRKGSLDERQKLFSKKQDRQRKRTAKKSLLTGKGKIPKEKLLGMENTGEECLGF